jgi:hypothetical protein
MPASTWSNPNGRTRQAAAPRTGAGRKSETTERYGEDGSGGEASNRLIPDTKSCRRPRSRRLIVPEGAAQTAHPGRPGREGAFGRGGPARRKSSAKTYGERGTGAGVRPGFQARPGTRSA